MILELISGFRTAPTTTLGAVTMATGDSAAVKSFELPGRAFLLNFWGKNQVAGNIRSAASGCTTSPTATMPRCRSARSIR